MPTLGSFAGEFEQTLPQIGRPEGALLTPQETVRYDFLDANGVSRGELRVLFTPTLLAQAIEFIAHQPLALDEMEALAEPYLPPDASVIDEWDEENGRAIALYLSVALADSPEMSAFTTMSSDDDPPDPGTVTLELAPDRWLLRPGRWARALPEA
jgi:hypothetical protein